MERSHVMRLVVWTTPVEAFMGSELEMGWAVALRMEKRELSGVGTCRG